MTHDNDLVSRALDNIRDLNMLPADENGHRWANSDLIDQEVMAGKLALRALTTEAGDGWHPIETAPKDGTEFLIAYSDGTVRAGRYLDNSHTTRPWQGVRPMYGAESAGRKITHWRPLPSPPATEGEA